MKDKEQLCQLELTSERFNDARNIVRNALQRSNDWKTFYGIAPITEAYARGDIEIHLHLCLLPNLRSPVGKIENRNATLWERTNMPDLCVRMYRHPNLEFRPPTNEPCKLNTPRYGSQNRDEAMLVGIVQFMKKKKGAVPTPVPSLVWLKRLNACPKTPMDALEEAQAMPFMPEMRDGIVAVSLPSLCATNKINRKCSSVIGLGIVQEGELPCQKVKCGAEIVDNLPNENPIFIRECWGGILNSDIVASSLSVKLSHDNTVGISFEEPLKSIIQGYELAICPLDLSSWPIEWVHSISSISVVYLCLPHSCSRPDFAAWLEFAVTDYSYVITQHHPLAITADVEAAVVSQNRVL